MTEDIFIRQAGLQEVGKAMLRVALTSVHVIQPSDVGCAGKRNTADHLAKKIKSHLVMVLHSLCLDTRQLMSE